MIARVEKTEADPCAIPMTIEQAEAIGFTSGMVTGGDMDVPATTLDERMEAAGMTPLSKLLAGDTPLEKWMAHTSVRDMASFEKWLLMRQREIMHMRMAYELGDKDKTDEMYEWVFAHTAALGEVISNFRKALTGTATPKPEGRPYCLFCDVDFAGDICPSCRSSTHVSHHPTPTNAGVTEAAAALVNFAWSAVVTDCTESAEYLNELVDNLRSALETTSAGDGVPGMVLITGCASEACGKQATIRFERGGVGSYYCHDCYMRIQAIPASSGETKP